MPYPSAHDTRDWITIHDVARGMGLELGDREAVSIGLRMAMAYLWETGHLPLKDLRTKKSGVGVHCFALYPPSFRPRMELIIRGYRPPEADQLSLFE